MSTINQSTIETQDEPDLSTEKPEVREWTINGYDGGNKRSVFREPSLYLSIVVIFMATSVVLGKTPTIFWSTFIALTVLAIIFHVLAERVLFRANKENKGLAAPLEGIFVVTLGAILPGLGLLAYGIHSLMTTQLSGLADISKLALLLVAPLFNFCVWSAVRKKYLVHPRLVGTMNGLSLGLSISWTVVWLKVMFLPHSDASIKLGWMLLLFSAPFLLFAATCLSFDLWRKTESRIRKITATFSVLGGVLSMLFVFTPIARSCYVQSLLSEAKEGATTQKVSAVSLLRSITAPEDLRPSRNPVSGYALGTLLLPDKGLDPGTDADRDAFFKITGKPFVFAGDRSESDTQQTINVGDKVPGLFLSKSQLTGTIDATTLSASIDWLFAFHNTSSSTQEVRAEISLPKGAVVSRATLWVNGEPREAAFAATTKTREAYDAIVRDQKHSDPLLVTMPAADRVLIQCYPVPAGGGKTKLLLGFKVPLETTSYSACSLQVPALLSTNFTQPKRHRISISTKDVPLNNTSGIVSQMVPNGYILHGFIKTEKGEQSKTSLSVERTAALTIATPDFQSLGQRFIVQRIREVTTPAPKRLFVVLDQSESLKSESKEIEKALSKIPQHIKPKVFLVSEQNPELIENHKSGLTWKEAKDAFKTTAFVGGQDNRPILRETLEVAAEEPDSAILWIHGVQPLTQKLADSAPLDLVHSVSLYDIQIGSGSNAVLQSIQSEDVSRQIRYKNLEDGSITNRLTTLVSKWQNGDKQLIVERTLSANRPQITVVTDRTTSEQVSCLWANDEVSRLIAADQEGAAIALAAKYRLVSSITGAVVLESAADYAKYNLNPGAYKAALPPASYSMTSIGGGLIGAPVDPRYGQCNEVGQLSDFGYDTARDISRATTALSLLISIAVAGFYLRSAMFTGTRLGKAVILVFTAPTIVHLVGTFMINNFSGLGGGL